MKNSRYRKKPLIVEAMKFWNNPAEISEFLGDIEHRIFDSELEIYAGDRTLVAEPGDWVAKGVDDNSLYVYEEALFRLNHEPECWPEEGEVTNEELRSEMQALRWQMQALTDEILHGGKNVW